MKKYKQYRYIGINGIITSRVLLDNVNHIEMYRIEADPGFILTNGELMAYATTVNANELESWYEIVDNNRKDT